jgi:hypothetical protein
MRLSTAMTAATPMTTPISVSTLRSLCAQRLPVAIPTAAVGLIVDARAMSREGILVPHPNIRAAQRSNYGRKQQIGQKTDALNGRKQTKYRAAGYECCAEGASALPTIEFADNR